MWMETHRIETKSLYLKLLELWLHMIKWCHPKMVTSGAGRLSAPLATPLHQDVTLVTVDETFCLQHYFQLIFI